MAKPNEDLHKLIRKALNHLYNPDYLRRSPLVNLLGFSKQFDTPKKLQRILIQAIDALQYKSGGARDERRIFYRDLLYDRYIQKLSQEEMASKFGISLRQFAREQDHSIDLLAMILAEKYPPLASIWGTASLPHSEGKFEEIETSDLDGGATEIPLNLLYEVEIVLKLFEPFARQKQITIETQLSTGRVGALVDPVAFRQALLLVINVVFHYADTKRILIQADQIDHRLSIAVRVETIPGSPQVAICPEDQAGLELARRLIERDRGQVDSATTSDGLLVTISFPAFQHSIILLIDRDPEFQQLIRSFIQGTRYQVASTHSAEQAVEWVTQFSIDIILLDVMSSDFDGWQLLVKLQKLPQASRIPVIVCSAIPLEELATSLGARDYVLKPVTQEMLLDILDRIAYLIRS